MNFKGHFIGGLASGSLLTAGTYFIGYLAEKPPQFAEYAVLFPITLFFALFPDFDTSSIPQRWFFRAVFIAILVMAYYKYFEEATILALIAITPVLDHHRGWTHNYFSPILIPFALAGIYEYLASRERWLQGWLLENVNFYLQDNLWLVLACLTGWYTHLLLDSPFPVFKNSRSHR